MKSITAFFSALLFWAAAGAQSVPSFVRDSLDSYVEKGLTDWKIPGVAVCVVKDGAVVVMKGYGVREAGGTERVDENTLFMIGSNTKAFTATALALLEAEKKLSLGDKVQKWLPDFRLYDPWVAREATIADLLCHRLGFETFQGDFMFFDSDLTRAEVREKFGRLQPRYGFRSRWGYTNAAFMTAGEIIPKVTGASWADFIKKRIFSPLGMTRSLVLSTDMAAAPNHANAHTLVKGELKKIPFGRLENMGPAGSISSSVADMSRWALMQLGNGKLDGREMVPQQAITRTRTPHSILGSGGGHPYNKSHFSLYGLGWFLEEYSGREIIHHTGGVNGFLTSVALVPEENLGILVFSNSDAQNFYEALRYELMDAYLGLPYRNYSGEMVARARQQEAEQEKWLQAKKDTVAMHPSPAAALQAFAGSYVHPVYGNMNIRLTDGKLVATFEHHKGRFAELGSLGGNRFLASFNDPLYGSKVWPFTLDKGRVQSVTVTVADFVEFTPYEFRKIK